MFPGRYRSWWLAGVAGGALLLIGLGVLEVLRLGEQKARNSSARAARALPVVLLDDPAAARAAALTGLDNRRVRLTGRYDHAAEILLRDRWKGGVEGVRVVTPLVPLRGDSAVLVDRGFVPLADLRKTGRSALEEPGVQEVSGIALAQPDSGAAAEPEERDGMLTWRVLDLRAVRERLPYPVQGFIVQQLPDPALPALPRRDPPPD